jgi:hypothetical protein
MQYYNKYLKYKNKYLKLIGGNSDEDIKLVYELLKYLNDTYKLLVISMQSEEILDEILLEISNRIIPILDNHSASNILKSIKFKKDIVTIDTDNFINFYSELEYIKPDKNRYAQNLYDFLMMYMKLEYIKEFIKDYENKLVYELLKYLDDNYKLLVIIPEKGGIDMQSEEVLDKILLEMSYRIMLILNNNGASNILKSIKFEKDIVTIATDNFINFYLEYMKPERYRCAQNLNAFLLMYMNLEDIKEFMRDYENKTS